MQRQTTQEMPPLVKIKKAVRFSEPNGHHFLGSNSQVNQCQN